MASLTPELDGKAEEDLSTEERMAWLRARGVLIEEPAGRKREGAPPSGRPFRYVRIPMDEAHAVEELAGHAPEGLGDALPALLARCFAGDGGLGDEELKAHMKANGQDVEVSAMRAVMAQGGAESFRLAVPTEGNGREGVYAYLDEAAALKALPQNKRATALAKQCGFPDTIILSGDIYIGRQKWSASGTVENVDFLIQELEPTSLWIRRAPVENLEFQKESKPEQHAEAQAGMKDGPAGGEGEGYSWKDEGEEVEVSVTIEKGTPKRDVKVEFKSRELRVLKPVTLNLKLHAAVEVDDCTWTLGDGKIVVTLAKKDPQSWPSLAPPNHGATAVVSSSIPGVQWDD